MSNFHEKLCALKNMDLLGKPIEMEINSKHTKNSRRYKTWPGFVFTMLCMMLCLSYLSYLIYTMQTGENDKYSRDYMTNTFKDGFQVFNLSNTMFLPTLDISFLNERVKDNLEYLNQN